MLQNLWYQIGRWLITLYVRLIVRADVYRDAPMPRGAKILAVNHPSTNDPAFITMLSGEHMTILIKETVFKVPLFGLSLRFAGHVPVVAGSGCDALEEGVRLLRAGHTVMIFPEGEISPADGFQKPHTGVARLALATGVPVVPVGISVDSKRVHRTHSMIDGQLEPISWYLHGPYAMTVGKAQRYGGSLEDREQVRAVTGQIMESVIHLSRRGDLRLANACPNLSSASPKTAIQVAWKGTWLGFSQSARLLARTPVFRMAEPILVILMMYIRQYTG
jgi:1-acyl-sn-glycerol-3-phosphate acyltransferase